MEYQAWSTPSAAKVDQYLESLRIDLSRVHRSLERATHPYHRSTLEKARIFLQGLFEKATRRG